MCIPGSPWDFPEGLWGQNYLHNNANTLFAYVMVLIFALIVLKQIVDRMMEPE